MSDLDADQSPLLSDIQYVDLAMGRRFGPYKETLAPELVDRLRSTIGVTRPGVVAGADVFPVLFLKVLRRAFGGIPTQTVLAKEELEFHAPVTVGSAVQCVTWVGEKYVRRARRYVVVEFEITTSDGELALTGRKVIVWPEAVV